MTEKCLIGNPQHDLSGTLFTRCFWYTIISVLTTGSISCSGLGLDGAALGDCKRDGKSGGLVSDNYN